MARSITQMKERLFQFALTSRFVDPITGIPPTSECALTALFAVYAQRQVLRWDAILLYSPESLEAKADASTLLSRPGTFVSEYPLLHRDPSEERIWGWMPADLVYTANDLSSVVLFENKVGSDFQYGSATATSQLGRQIDYLRRAPASQVTAKTLILLTGREFVDLGWYRSEFDGALRHDNRGKDVTGLLMFWEDVVKALMA